MRAELSKLHRRLDATMVYVTHDQVEAMTLGDRIAVLKAGELQQVGAPLELYERPKNAFVAGFIGTPPMNLLAATVGGGGETLEGAGFTLPVPPAFRNGSRLVAGRSVLLGIRPEHLLAGGRAANGPSAPIAVELDLLETLGHQSLAHGHLGPAPVVAILDPHDRAQAGSALELAVPLAAVHLFDADTSERIRS
jgi:multiple sugar transport system ATP-binding protein